MLFLPNSPSLIVTDIPEDIVAETVTQPASAPKDQNTATPRSDFISRAEAARSRDLGTRPAIGMSQATFPSYLNTQAKRLILRQLCICLEHTPRRNDVVPGAY